MKSRLGSCGEKRGGLTREAMLPQTLLSNKTMPCFVAGRQGSNSAGELDARRQAKVDSQVIDLNFGIWYILVCI